MDICQKEKNHAIKFRILLVIHYLKGKKVDELCEIFLLNRDQIYYWLRKYKKYGINGILSPPSKRGRKQKVNLAELKEALKHDPKDFGYPENGWTVQLIHQFITEKMGIVIHRNYVYQLLQKINWKPQKRTMKRKVQYVTRSGKELTPHHLDMMKKVARKLNAPIDKIITENGIDPILHVVLSTHELTILQGETELGTLTITFEENK